MIRIVVPGPPPRKNARGTIGISRRTGKPVRITPKRTKAWRSRLYDAVYGQDMPLYDAGRWSLTLDIYESELRHLDVDVPYGDIDSSITAVCDALQPKYLKRGRSGVLTMPGVIDDDARIVSATIRKHYDKHNPRVEIVLEEVTGG